MAAALARAGYVVQCAGGGEQALRLAARYGGAADLVLAAVVLPGMSGPLLAGRLLATRRARRALFMSGYSGDDLARHGVSEWGDDFLAKPFSAHALVRRVRRALGR